jgi:hypothetical protein
MRARYVTSRTYKDSGVLRSVLHRPGETSRTRTAVSFRTAFDRSSGGFYLELLELPAEFFAPSRTVIWRAESGIVNSWSDDGMGEIKRRELSAALDASRGASNGITGWIPPLLLEASCCEDELRYRIAGRTTIDGAAALRLAAKGPGRRLTLFVRTRDFALLRVQQQLVIPGKQLELTESARQLLSPAAIALLKKHAKEPLVADTRIDFYPSFDDSVGPSAFEFTPPRTGPG